MRTYRAPGVYVVEDQTTPMPLTGVPTGVPCFFGFTEQGPSAKPVRVTSMNEFYAVFGKTIQNRALFKSQYLADSLYGFFLNGGSEAYICRTNNGKQAAWPIESVENVIDFGRWSDPLDPLDPNEEGTPGWFQLNVGALSGGTWANKLRIVIDKTKEADPLPAIETKVKLTLPSADGFKLVTLDSIQPTSDTLLPRAALLAPENVKLKVGEVEGAWQAAVKGEGDNPSTPAGFLMGEGVLTEQAGTLEYTAKEGQDPHVFPVKVTPPARLETADLKITEGDGDDLEIAGPDDDDPNKVSTKSWTSKTLVTFRDQKVDGGKRTTTLTGTWDADESCFYVTDADGNSFILAAGQVASEGEVEGMLLHPARMNADYRIQFDLHVVEPVPPVNPGDRPGTRVLESYPGLSTNPKDAGYYQLDGIINGVSNRIVVGDFDASAGSTIVFGTKPDGSEAELEVALGDAGGAKVINTGSDELPAPTSYGKFFQLLKQVSDVSLIACPDAFVNGPDKPTPAFSYQPVYQAAINYCEQNRCMVVIDCPPLPEAKEIGDLNKRAEVLQAFADRFRSTHAAIYSPWLITTNLDQGSDKKTVAVPPSGFMLGAYNRSDNSVGVWKAPANMPVNGPVGLQLPFTEDSSEILNPAGVNLIRQFPGYGTLIWGARTTTKKVMWQYVNVRRLFLYVERTLKQQTQWAVFESNDRKTWNRLVNAAENFLRALWLDGGLMGDSPDQAFRVRCGIPETMTMTDVETGLLKVEIAIAPVRPAEFVVFTVSQLVQTAQSG